MAFDSFERRLLSPEELATYLGISTKTVWNWRSLRQGPPAYKLGSRAGRVRYRLADVDEWLEEHRDLFEEKG